MFSYIAVACVLGVAASAPSGYTGASLVTAVDSMSIPRYGFNYAVNDPMTGDHKAQSESRDGGVVRGSYSLSEADGTLRVVEYAADPVSGFNAVVRRLGHAAHPQALAAPPVLAKQLVNTGASALVAPVGAVHLGGLAGLGGMGGMGGMGGLGSYGGLGLGHGGAGLGLGGLGHAGLGLGGLGHDGLGLGGLGLGGLSGLGGYGGGKH